LKFYKKIIISFTASQHLSTASPEPTTPTIDEDNSTSTTNSFDALDYNQPLPRNSIQRLPSSVQNMTADEIEKAEDLIEIATNKLDVDLKDNYINEEEENGGDEYLESGWIKKSIRRIFSNSTTNLNNIVSSTNSTSQPIPSNIPSTRHSTKYTANPTRTVAKLASSVSKQKATSLRRFLADNSADDHQIGRRIGSNIKVHRTNSALYEEQVPG
jgi:hypothetical protein